MKTLTFPEIADLLNEVSLAKFPLDPVQQYEDVLAVFEGSYFLSNGDEAPARVLYILSTASEKALRLALRKVAITASTEVVYPPSSAAAARAIDWKSAGAKRAVSSKEYLIAFMRAELGKYRSELQSLLHQDLEKPSVETPSGVKARIPNPLELFLGESQSADDQGQIAVLLAEAGHGKTYLSEWIAGRLATSDDRVLPIFVSAKQWVGLVKVGGASLEEIICNSFRAYGCPVRWAEGRERKFLSVALGLGVFRLIFDGFDEFALQSTSKTSAGEALGSLISLAAETGAKVLVTARTSFWESQVLEESANLSEAVDLYTLLPFDPQKAQNYFQRKLGGDPAKVDAANNVFHHLHKSNPTLAGRGVVLRLVADLAESGGSLASNIATEPVSWLMYSLCERDKERQKLPIGPEEQLAALREFVVMTSTGDAATDETLGLSLQYAGELDDVIVGDVLRRFSSHALIQRSTTGSWNFLNTQVELTLLAQTTVKAALAKSGPSEAVLSKLNANARLRPDQIIDLADIVLALLSTETEPPEPTERCAKLIGFLLRASPVVEGHSQGGSLFRRLAASVALRSEEVSKTKGRLEKSQALKRLSGGASIEGLYFTKTLANFDFSGIDFRQCTFQDVTFSRCKFDEATRFFKCRIEDGEAHQCEGLGRAVFLDCTYSTSGREFLRSQQVREGTKSYGTDDLNRDLRALVDKFVRQAGAAFKSVEEADLAKGKISTSPHMKEVTAAFVKHVLDHVHISGTPSGGFIVKPAAREAVMFFYQNNSLVGAMSEAATAVRARLNL